VDGRGQHRRRPQGSPSRHGRAERVRLRREKRVLETEIEIEILRRASAHIGRESLNDDDGPLGTLALLPHVQPQLLDAGGESI
jgi:hypothetical protein